MPHREGALTPEPCQGGNGAAQSRPWPGLPARSITVDRWWDQWRVDPWRAHKPHCRDGDCHSHGCMGCTDHGSEIKTLRATFGPTPLVIQRKSIGGYHRMKSGAKVVATEWVLKALIGTESRAPGAELCEEVELKVTDKLWVLNKRPLRRHRQRRLYPRTRPANGLWTPQLPPIPKPPGAHNTGYELRHCPSQFCAHRCGAAPRRASSQLRVPTRAAKRQARPTCPTSPCHLRPRAILLLLALPGGVDVHHCCHGCSRSATLNGMNEKKRKPQWCKTKPPTLNPHFRTDPHKSHKGHPNATRRTTTTSLRRPIVEMNPANSVRSRWVSLSSSHWMHDHNPTPSRHA